MREFADRKHSAFRDPTRTCRAEPSRPPAAIVPIIAVSFGDGAQPVAKLRPDRIVSDIEQSSGRHFCLFIVQLIVPNTLWLTPLRLTMLKRLHRRDRNRNLPDDGGHPSLVGDG